MSNVPDMPKMSDDPLDQSEFLVRILSFLVDETLRYNQTEIAYKLISLTFELADKLNQDKNENLLKKPGLTF
jgi:hypothetical protein